MTTRPGRGRAEEGVYPFLGIPCATPPVAPGALRRAPPQPGGGFTGGCHGSPWYRGTRFARDGMVLVSVNDRLGIQGSLHIPAAPAPVSGGDLAEARQATRP